MNEKNEFVHILRHYRHDWLNHIQVIKGYIGLGKGEEALRYIDQIVIKAHEDTITSQLRDENLAYFLLTYNWKQDKIRLEVEMEDQVAQEALYHKTYPYLLSWFSTIVGFAEQGCAKDDENHLFFLFEVRENELLVKVEYEGVWQPESNYQQMLRVKEHVQRDNGQLEVIKHDHQGFIFDLVHP